MSDCKICKWHYVSTYKEYPGAWPTKESRCVLEDDEHKECKFVDISAELEKEARRQAKEQERIDQAWDERQREWDQDLTGQDEERWLEASYSD